MCCLFGLIDYQAGHSADHQVFCKGFNFTGQENFVIEKLMLLKSRFSRMVSPSAPL